MPGPINTWDANYEVDDGTSCRMPSRSPGPTEHRSPNMLARAEALYDAYERAQVLAPAAVLQKTGYALGQLLKGLLPGLLQTLIILAASTVLGAVAGGVIGFFFAGAGAAPGAVLGGELGLEIGTAVLSWLGLAFLAVAIVQGFGELKAELSAGVKRAWAAPEYPDCEYPHQIEKAAHDFANAAGILLLLILKGIVAWVFKRAAVGATEAALATGNSIRAAGSEAAAGEAVGAVVAQLRVSRLGSGFADWVEENWPRLRDDPRLRFEVRRTGGTRAAETSEEASTAVAKDSTKAEAQPAQNAAEATARLETARQYYSDHGWPEKRIQDHLKGIDPSKPVTVEELQPGEIVGQYQKAGDPQGNYYSEPGTNKSTLGVPPEKNSEQLFRVTKPVKVLKSTAADIKAWDGSGRVFKGGSEQIFCPDSSAFEPVAKDAK
jgi:hypothetical protein